MSSKKQRVNNAYAKLHPRNCPLIEKTADGVVVGTCTFFMRDGRTCPRHGDISRYLRGEEVEA